MTCTSHRTPVLPCALALALTETQRLSADRNSEQFLLQFQNWVLLVCAACHPPRSSYISRTLGLARCWSGPAPVEASDLDNLRPSAVSSLSVSPLSAPVRPAGSVLWLARPTQRLSKPLTRLAVPRPVLAPPFPRFFSSMLVLKSPPQLSPELLPHLPKTEKIHEVLISESPHHFFSLGGRKKTRCAVLLSGPINNLLFLNVRLSSPLRCEARRPFLRNVRI